METTAINYVNYTYNKSELQKRITNTIGLIEDWCVKNDYQINGLPIGLNKMRMALSSNDLVSKTQLKKINRYIIGLEKHITMRRANKFFQLLTETCGYAKVNVKCSYKEDCIQTVRKKWLKAREESDRLLNEYKVIKGDYYKNK